jgi:hypothetical protein
MGRRERRFDKKSAKEFHSRKAPKADRRVLFILGGVTVLVVLVTYSLRYSGAI